MRRTSMNWPKRVMRRSGVTASVARMNISIQKPARWMTSFSGRAPCVMASAFHNAMPNGVSRDARFASGSQDSFPRRSRQNWSFLSMASTRAPHPLPVTRGSIFLGMKMDCRVKPGNDVGERMRDLTPLAPNYHSRWRGQMARADDGAVRRRYKARSRKPRARRCDGREPATGLGTCNDVGPVLAAQRCAVHRPCGAARGLRFRAVARGTRGADQYLSGPLPG